MVWVIAEAGSCHEGEWRRALQLTEVAAKAGAQAIKWQYWSSPQRLREQRAQFNPAADAYEVGSIPSEWFLPLSSATNMLGLDFMCTAFLPEDVSTVRPFVDAHKVSSFEANDREFVERVVKPDGLDSRMAFVSLGLVDPVPQWLYDGPYTLLHCVSKYPCTLDEARLDRIWRDNLDGFSDHTRRVETGELAVEQGARVLEVHFRLDDTREACPDYPVALTPGELKEYIRRAQAQAERPKGKHDVLA